MAKLSNAKIKYIIANINVFEPLTYIKTTKGDAPEVKTPSREIVCNIIDACKFFRNFGHESAKINAMHNGDNTIVTIEIFSQSPDKSTWGKQVFLFRAQTNCLSPGSHPDCEYADILE